jgi:hypothetical protein
MKKFLQLTLVGLALSVALLARGGTYQDGDVLLIFRESGYNDVEFDIGSVSNFLNQPTGHTVPVTVLSNSLLTTVFGPDLTGVSVILAATTSLTNASRAAWLSLGNPAQTVSDVTASGWQSSLWSVIDSIGTRPGIYLAAQQNWVYSIDPGGTYKIASYDNIVSAGGVNDAYIAEFGGNVSFTVEQIVPGTFGFWQIQPTNAAPKPAASYVGSFSVATNGNLTFVAGPVAPTLLGITRSGNVNTVGFTTLPGFSYSLVYTNTLGGPITNWAVASGPVTGTGGNNTLSHTNTAGAGFYGVIASP